MAAVSQGVARRARQGRRARRETISFYLFISPWLLGFICLSLIPLVIGFMTSLSNYNGYNLSTVRFIGLDNYVRAFNDRNALYALGRTITFTLITVPLNLVISFSIALLLNQRIFARGFFRTLFYLPSIIPLVAVAWIWKLMMDQNFGLVNALISYVVPNTAIRWLSDYPTAVLVMLSVWISTGGAMIIFLAGLQGVPRELEEAARIDGANLFQMFRAITLPLITPVVFYQLVLSIIFSLQVLVEPILLGGTSSGSSIGTMPPRPNYLYMVHTYNQIFINQRFGYGSALLWLLFAMILGLTLVVFRTSRYWVYYEMDQEEGRS
jgi:multiple sugar transport system permease protein